jgi:hypothetical protein
VLRLRLRPHHPDGFTHPNACSGTDHRGRYGEDEDEDAADDDDDRDEEDDSEDEDTDDEEGQDSD